ncbi:hypothetical protein O181_046112 [Austropuccinia psidii MF-1]|uniref:DNA helicase Pif1-like 2B domain-containing protein n=1 Tax=Austropuccinia psidii MF-1 TaxID=1389203 RepID=A0A9Q3HJD5_9BASI|nr:hypothetical protein [Austropuccinia psidii MF-1]
MWVPMTSNGSIKDKINCFNSLILLAPLNANVKEFNKMLLDQLKSEEYISYSIDRLAEDESHAVPEEVLSSLSKPAFPGHKIHLKLGVPLLLLCNLRIPSGLCNGTRLLLTAIQPNVLKCKHMDGPNQFKSFLIPKIKLLYEEYKVIGARFYWDQFPVTLAYVMTIKKAQGQSFDTVGVCLPQEVFSHVQLYVSLSRIRNAAKIIICSLCPPGSKEIMNVVCKDLFN